ncbi:MAG: hypothetical protein WD534_05235 [Phycisphaeraceae bacterium]
MANRVFLRRETGELEQLESRSFAAEDEIDALIASDARLLAAALSTDERRLQFLLVDRQVAIDDGEVTGRWSADLVFLDNEGVLTVVEDKLSRNADIRRKVIGQGIEYVANIATTWTSDHVKKLLAQRLGDWQPAVSNLIGLDDGRDDFWARVTKNLRLGRLRLVFAANELPRELRVAIEFLNQVTGPMEVAGVAVQLLPTNQVSGELEIVVASSVGLTERKVSSASAGDGPGWEVIDADAFFGALTTIDDTTPCGEAALSISKRLIAKSDVFKAEFFRTVKAGESVAWFTRHADMLNLVEVRVIPHHRIPKCEVITLRAHHWPRSLRESLETLTGLSASGRLRLRDWLNSEPANVQRFLDWLNRSQQIDHETQPNS